MIFKVFKSLIRVEDEQGHTVAKAKWDTWSHSSMVEAVYYLAEQLARHSLRKIILVQVKDPGCLHRHWKLLLFELLPRLMGQEPFVKRAFYVPDTDVMIKRGLPEEAE